MRKLPWYTHVGNWCGFALLYVPLLFVALQSFNASRHGQGWGGATLKWYGQLLGNQQIQGALWNTLLVAIVSTLFSTVLGTLLAIGLHRTPWGKKWRAALQSLIQLPVVTPDILMAVALVGAYGALRSVSQAFEPGYLTLIVGHITFQISFVTLVVQARLVAIGPEQMEAARDLYATTWGAWRRVVLPQLATGILAGALLAFTLSLDDFIISFFVSGPQSTTLPLLIYASLRRGLSPEIHAVSTVVVVLTLLALLAVALDHEWENREERFIRVGRRVLRGGGAALFAGLVLYAGAGTAARRATASTGAPVTVLSYSEYIDPAMIGQFTERTGYPLQIDVYEAQEEMIAKLQASGTGQYDVIIASDVNIRQMIALGLIRPLDAAKVPNAANVDPLFRSPVFDPGNRYSWPYLWGTTGVLYRRQEGEEERPFHWADILDPARAPGPFTLLDEGRTMLAIALQASGAHSDSKDSAEIARAAELLLRSKASGRCLGFDGSVSGKDKVLGKRAWGAVVFNGEAVSAMDEDSELRYVIPAEGSSIWVDVMTMSANAPNPDGAHAFMNYILDAKVGAQLANFIRFGSPNRASFEFITPEDQGNLAIYPDAETRQRLDFLSDPGRSQRLFEEAWTIVKSR